MKVLLAAAVIYFLFSVVVAAAEGLSDVKSPEGNLPVESGFPVDVPSKETPSKYVSPIEGKACTLSGRRVGCSFHPILKYWRYHWGVDLQPSTMNPPPVVHAVHDGKVLLVGNDSGYGHSLIIDHGDGHFTRYAHMARVPLVKEGDKIDAGQPIGEMGHSGLAEGPHLHMEFLKKCDEGTGGWCPENPIPDIMKPEDLCNTISPINPNTTKPYDTNYSCTGLNAARVAARRKPHAHKGKKAGKKGKRQKKTVPLPTKKRKDG